MKLKDLNTPFEKKRMLTYGRDGTKAVHHYVEVQQIAGNLYKSRTEMVSWGYEECRLYLSFPDCPDGLDLGYLSCFGERTVEDMEQDYKANGLDSPQHFIETVDAQIAAGGFVGNTLIEFVKGWSPKKAMEYAAARQAYLDRQEQKEANARAQQLMKEKEKEEQIKREKETRRTSLLGWGDTLPELQLNRALAVLSKQYRYNGVVKTRRQHVIDCIAEGYRPDHREQQKEYRLLLPQENYFLSYSITKTEYEFACYLYNERIGQNA